MFSFNVQSYVRCHNLVLLTRVSGDRKVSADSRDVPSTGFTSL